MTKAIIDNNDPNGQEAAERMEIPPFLRCRIGRAQTRLLHVELKAPKDFFLQERPDSQPRSTISVQPLLLGNATILHTNLPAEHRTGPFAIRCWGWLLGALRVLIAEDHEVARQGIRSIIESHPGWEVCAEAKDGREAVEAASKLKPDVLLLDIGMPNLNGLDAARQILAAMPDARILILTIHDSEQVVREVLAAGARGFLLKSDAGRDLLAAVDALQHRRTFFTPKIAQMMLDGYLRPSEESDSSGQCVLTPREREVIQLVAEGKTTKEVATALSLSVKTAETHRTNLMRKLNLHSVADLTLYAVRNGIVQIY
jgi:DNA-binding NarL/FixJ family response regulator